MKEIKIHNLFPTPIYMSNIDRAFTKKELQFVEKEKNHTAKNDSNVSSVDNYILNRKELKNIKSFLNDCCKDYLDKIICPKNNIELYITQSWLNYTEENEYHHKHEHPNSVVSGILYFNSDINTDMVRFFSHIHYKQLSVEIDNEKYNRWNSGSWWFPVETGQLVMFPSSTTHQVDIKKGTKTRISLAFNTFYKGTLGLNDSLTELIL